MPWGRTLFESRHLPARIAELEASAANPTIWNDHEKANALFARLRALKKQWEPVLSISVEIADALELIECAIPKDEEHFHHLLTNLQEQWGHMQTELYLSGEFDTCNCYLTVSGGAGGTEAQDWAAMLLRMYIRYCERQQWETHLLEKTDGQEAGIKSATIHVTGSLAYGHLKCERGTHRLVRLSPFNAKNLRQTSFALVEVLPELPETTDLSIPPHELRVDTFRSGGAGGQHVNKTESAVRVTHLPSGIVVSCQTERSQLQNRAQAMNILRAKILDKQRQEEMKQKKELRGASESADFGQQIRSYVLHPYKMVKDLRTNVETSNPDAILDGELQEFIEAELKREATL
ncbi:peptide chain release factor 2 [Candidatus Peregrinibacteria bacterium]|nr:peptide chain release factor 2 [Candidatus Peregrinibacteria bacterium]